MPELNRIYTVGYQSFKKLEKLVDLAREKEANLVDIRYRPWSKDEQFQADNIQAAFLAAGLPGRYWWVRELGNVNYNNQEPIKLWNPTEGVERIQEFAEIRPVILMCACWDLMTCHRLVAAELLEKEWGISVEHVQAVPKEALPADKPPPPPFLHQLGIW
jgi:uncharacterized protein (DUF488 family)